MFNIYIETAVVNTHVRCGGQSKLSQPSESTPKPSSLTTWIKMGARV